MGSPLANAFIFGITAIVILASAVFSLFFTNMLKGLSSHWFPDDRRKKYMLGRAPGTAMIRYLGVMETLAGLTALAGSLYWASKL